MFVNFYNNTICIILDTQNNVRPFDIMILFITDLYISYLVTDIILNIGSQL